MIYGVSGIFGHDSAISVYGEKDVLKLFEEERLLRFKRAQGMVPSLSLNAACDSYSNMPNSPIRIALSWGQLNCYHSRFWGKIKDLGCVDANQIELVHFDHHLCHAAYSLSHTDLTDCGFLVADGHAENKSITYGVVKDGTFEVLGEHNIRASLGHFYEAVSNHVGLGYSGVGKLMGLAAYARSREDEFGFTSILLQRLSEDIGELDMDYRKECRDVLTEWSEILSKIVTPVRNVNYEEILSNDTENILIRIASSAQSAIENVLESLINKIVRSANSRDIVFGGGVALNCAANGSLERSMRVNLHVGPASGDSGACLGAAYLCADTIPKSQTSPYLGMEYNDNQIMSWLDRLNVPYMLMDDPASKLVEYIERGKIVGRFTGCAEIGPRALGNRSMLCRADSIEMKNKLNNLKNRELWRPFAPAVKWDSGVGKDIFNTYSPYMLKATHAAEGEESLKGAVHIDGTSRVQTVSKEINADFYDLLSSASERGLEGLLNTSFNDDLEPIVYSPRDALRTFFSTELSLLQIGDNLVVAK